MSVKLYKVQEIRDCFSAYLGSVKATLVWYDLGNVRTVHDVLLVTGDVDGVLAEHCGIV